MKTKFWVSLSCLRIGDVFEVEVEGVLSPLRKTGRCEGKKVDSFGLSHRSPSTVILPSETYVRVEGEQK